MQLATEALGRLTTRLTGPAAGWVRVEARVRRVDDTETDFGNMMENRMNTDDQITNRGLEYWADGSSYDPDLPDLFVADEGRWEFPCCACLHVEDEIEHCKGCRHYCA